jgi:hypothetical protein
MDRDRNTTGIYGDNRTAPYEMHRQNRPQLLTRMVFPASYTRNTQKEDLVLESVENFRTQYVSLCPGRAPLLLSPHNECNFRKFIATFIRPTLLKFGELYDYDSCAKFIANYIQYEHLEDSESLPTRVVSPTTVLAWQVGNSVEMSILLCSILLGSGYNAFVVVGYAEKQVCDNDQTNTNWQDSLPDERCSDDEAEVRAVPATEYTQYLRKRPVLVSQYDKELKEREKKQREDDMRIVVEDAGPGADEAAGAAAADKINYVHAWVLLMPGRRNITQPIFVEPSTGQTIPVKDADALYVGVESVFNHHNYFVNLKPAAAVSTLAMDLRDLTNWEHIFLKDPEAAEEEDDRQRQLEDLTSDYGDSGDTTLDLPASWVGPLTLSRAQYENRYPGRTKDIKYANATVKLFAEYSEPDLRVQVVLLPDQNSVHPQVHTFYRNRQDKLRRRSVYPQEHSTNPRRIHDWFDAGRKKETKVEGLRELIYEPGVLRTMKFYWKAREDGLARRHEQFYGEGALRKVQEYYKGRDEDRLVYRSASFEQAKESHGGGVAAGLQYAMTSTVGAKDQLLLEPFKMSEKFDRNPKIPADQDIQKRTYCKPQSPDGEIWVFYQYRDDSITRPSRLFPRNAEREKESANAASDIKPRITTMPYVDAPKETELSEQLRMLLEKEHECLTDIRAKAEECKEILTTLEAESKSVHRMLSAYDTLRNRPKETEAELAQMRAEESRRAESRKDYLAPYIAKLEIAKQYKGDYSSVRLTADQAKQVRDEALRELKERLIQRGHIMQNRMDHEKEELNKRQMSYQKNLDAADGSKESEEFAQFCKDATWRMKILDERLSRHIDQASEKYAQLAQRLAEDKRLAALYQQ